MSQDPTCDPNIMKGKQLPPRRSPLNPRSLVDMGNQCLKQGDFKGALVAYDLAATFLPEDAQLALLRAVALLQLGRWDECVASAEASLKLKPDQPSAHTLRGAALIELARYDEALHALDRALELNPSAPDAMYNKACAYSLMGEGEQALRWLQQAAEIYPDYREIAREDRNLEFLRQQPAFQTGYEAILGD